MKWILIIAVLLLSRVGYCQKELFISETDISTLDIKYIEVVFIYKAFGSNMAAVNFGQKLANNDNAIYENKEKKAFRNHIDMLNYLYKKGWVLQQEISRNMEAGYVFILKKG